MGVVGPVHYRKVSRDTTSARWRHGGDSWTNGLLRSQWHCRCAPVQISILIWWEGTFHCGGKYFSEDPGPPEF